MKYLNRWDLLEAAAKSGRMQEAAGVDPVCKTFGKITPFVDLIFDDVPSGDYEFPLTMVEGKQVWEGDTLYYYGEPKTVHSVHEFSINTIAQWSWNPPKPKTVMVELLDADVQYWVLHSPNDETYSSSYPLDYKNASKNFYIACRKALEKTSGS